MTAFTAIDLSLLPTPDVVETLDYEAILAALVSDFSARYPEHATALESDPAAKLLEVAAYRETLLRARVNDAARACMLASASGADLDQLGAWWGVARRETDPGDPLAVPPIPPTYEDDTAFRAQIQTSLESYTSAGSIGAYRWHALRADATLLDVGISSPTPGVVLASVLGPAGTPTQGQLDLVTAALNAEEVRPLCDTVTVEPATLAAYDITATLHMGMGPDAAEVLTAATAAVEAYCDSMRLCGARVAISAIMAALHQPGVQWVDLVAPADDVVATATQAPWLGTLALTMAQDTA